MGNQNQNRDHREDSIVLWKGSMKIDMRLLYECYVNIQCKRDTIAFNLNRDIIFGMETIMRITFKEGVDIHSNGIYYAEIRRTSKGLKINIGSMNRDPMFQRQLIYKGKRLFLT